MSASPATASQAHKQQ